MVIGASSAGPVRDAMMTATRTHIDPQTIDHLDFAPDLPCEHTQHHTGQWGHRGRGWALVEIAQCPGCADPEDRYVACQGSIEYLRTLGDFRCDVCSQPMSAAEHLRIIEVLR